MQAKFSSALITPGSHTTSILHGKSKEGTEHICWEQLFPSTNPPSRSISSQRETQKYASMQYAGTARIDSIAATPWLTASQLYQRKSEEAYVRYSAYRCVASISVQCPFVLLVLSTHFRQLGIPWARTTRLLHRTTKEPSQDLSFSTKNKAATQSTCSVVLTQESASSEW